MERLSVIHRQHGGREEIVIPSGRAIKGSRNGVVGGVSADRKYEEAN